MLDFSGSRQVALLLAGVVLPGAAFAVTAEIPLGYYTLSNGSGDGDVSVEVDAMGFIASAYFDPAGSIGSGSVIYDSFTTVSPYQANYGISGVASGASTLSVTANSMVSTFSVNNLAFTLTQTVADAIEDGVQTGSVLTQSFVIENTADVANSFEMYRYLDGDLYLTDQSLADGGGVTSMAGNIVVYQTDVLDGQTAEDTFIGITLSGEGAQGISYAVDHCCDLNLPLGNTVAEDLDGDGVTDETYDVTVSLGTSYQLAAGGSGSFVTTTIFGNGEPPVAGDSESNPILPSATSGDEVPAFDFVIPVVELVPMETFFIDPDIAVGYTYEVTGAAFHSVTAPSLVAVPDGDGSYVLSYGGNDYVLLAGATHVFSAPVGSFALSGIDVALMLDPSDATAFVTGISLTDFDPLAANVTITQTPVTVFVPDMPPVPLPAPVLLLAGGLGGLAGLRRLRAPPCAAPAPSRRAARPARARWRTPRARAARRCQRAARSRRPGSGSG
ncbi:hypothetical protein [Mangrovicoccus ximenensis]|uniref:hypothetical protein n=1 Tax=Mangrovicoccus ximenensis TaxID=1911570 RepID=UPI000D36F1AB|nr:hypothetical protein [Mangrovicoccus ximenensis]